MNPETHVDKFAPTFLWMAQEEGRLMKIIQTRGVKKHHAWRQLMELVIRRAQLDREVKRFLNKRTTGNK